MCLNIFATSGKVEEHSVGSPPGTLAPLMNFEAFVQIFIFLFPSDGPETSERSEQISLFFSEWIFMRICQIATSF